MFRAHQLALKGAFSARFLEDRAGGLFDQNLGASRLATPPDASQSAALNNICGTPAKTFSAPETWCGFPSSPGKGYDAFTTAPTAAVAAPTVLLVTGDAQPGDISTTATLIVNASPVASTIDTLGDFDFFKVELVQGQHYEIGQYLKVGGPSGVPLSDAYIELYDAAGNLITTADGGGPNTPSGLDALLSFQAEYSGTYYINARAFDQDGTNGTTGDAVGDYEIFVNNVSANPNTYIPLYTPDQPTHSIDWGSQVDRTSRNPDGNNGPRDNGAPNTGVVHNAQFDIYGKNVITYYFAKTGEVYVDEEVGGLATMVAEGMQQWEKDAFRLALDEYEKVTDNIYIEVNSRAEADFKFITYEGTPGAGASLLGRMSPPNESNEGQAEFNAGDVRWTQEGLSQGGFYFPTLLHELGHGHGLAHPHDNGGRSSIMPGADGGTGGLGGGFGDWGLSQQVFTIMSYNDGWNEGAPYSARPAEHGGPRSGGITGTEVDHFGWVGTLTALDIAVLQDKYGVNEEYATGDDVYLIKDENGAGNFYSCIWDAAGNDEIKYVGARNANIDLRAATLKYEEGGGGWVSYAMGAWTGFTIANGATIEKASGGDGHDTLIGNNAVNTLSGGNGDDWLVGGAGGDTLNGGAGADTASYDTAASGVIASLNKPSQNTGDAKGDTYSGIENLNGSKLNDTLTGDANANALSGQDGADSLYGLAGSDKLTGGAGDDQLTGGQGADVLDGGDGVDTARYDDSTSGVSIDLGANLVSGGTAAGDTLISVENLTGSGFKDMLTGNAGANTLHGLNGNDLLNGAGGDDFLYGGAGADELIGGAGADTFVFKRGEGGRDSVYDFDGANGDVLMFTGYGAAEQGASLTQIDDTRWMINSADGRVHDIITLVNGASIDSGDWMFGP
ncbi:MAG: matrixin family metalloprotease [Hyphomonadaceae bacterium]|nr:matrixin family metalloprotease [Hyphomonadaceae bacterium]